MGERLGVTSGWGPAGLCRPRSGTLPEDLHVQRIRLMCSVCSPKRAERQRVVLAPSLLVSPCAERQMPELWLPGASLGGSGRIRSGRQMHKVA